MRINYQLDTGWGCGLIIVEDGLIVNSAPIFRKLQGVDLKDLPKKYRIERIDSDDR